MKSKAHKRLLKQSSGSAVVVAQLVEWSLQIQRSAVRIQSSPKNYIYCQLYWKDENKEKEAENGSFFFLKNEMTESFVPQFFSSLVSADHLALFKKKLNAS